MNEQLIIILYHPSIYSTYLPLPSKKNSRQQNFFNNITPPSFIHSFIRRAQAGRSRCFQYLLSIYLGAILFKINDELGIDVGSRK